MNPTTFSRHRALSLAGALALALSLSAIPFSRRRAGACKGGLANPGSRRARPTESPTSRATGVTKPRRPSNG